MAKKKHNAYERNHRHHKADIKKVPEEESQSSLIFSFRTWFTVVCLGVAFWFSYKGYLETRVNTPYDSKKVVQKNGLDIPDRYWGSYRPGVYFGMKTREPFSPVMGLMWYFPRRLYLEEGIRFFNTRHWCQQDDKLDQYSWTEHDGRNYGVQNIVDNNIELTTSFLKRPGGRNGGDWTARISVTTKKKELIGEPVNLIFYAAIENQTKGFISPSHSGEITSIVGETQELGQFSLRLSNISGEIKRQSFLSVESRGLDLLTMTIRSTLRIIPVKSGGSGPTERIFILPGDLTVYKDGTKLTPNFVAVQLEARVPFQFDAIYQSASYADRPNALTGEIYRKELELHRKSFESRFHTAFGLHSKSNYSAEYMDLAKRAFSNLIGGIGYFYGASKVKSEHTDTPVPYWKAPLYTAVPSRSFFPRGFLWDEGFHGLILSAWDLDTELDIIAHWMDLMNIEGWIPREQILGIEALAKVPEEFVTQTNSNANPPTFFLTLRFIMRNYGDKLTEGDRLATLERLYPRLLAWFDWFNTTQTGPVPGSYRWRGRNPNSPFELNPKTLASGLDDYPRASHPTDSERHLDLRCWMLIAASTMADLARILNRDNSRFVDMYSYLSDIKLLDKLHWSSEKGRYADYGLHTDDVTLRKPPPPPHNARRSAVDAQLVRVVLTDPRYRFVDSSFGYVSLFPLIIKVLPSNSPKLAKILTDIRNPDLLWTSFGLRSLSKDSPLYMTRNTEHDPPYWRGTIWMNINYLILAALKHYADLSGPYQNESLDLYSSLRSNLISNIYKQYYNSGYIWEYYNDITGEGGGCHPFTGWSSLIVLIMSEIY